MGVYRHRCLHAAGRLASSAALAKARFPSRCAAHRCSGGCALAQPARASPAPPQCTWRECRACGHSTLVHRDRCGRGTPGDRYYGRFCGSSSLRAAGVLVEKTQADARTFRYLFAVPAASSPESVSFGVAQAHDADAAPLQCCFVYMTRPNGLAKSKEGSLVYRTWTGTGGEDVWPDLEALRAKTSDVAVLPLGYREDEPAAAPAAAPAAPAGHGRPGRSRSRDRARAAGAAPVAPGAAAPEAAVAA